MSPCLLKALSEVLNFYFKNVKVASMKHGILGKLADREFLAQNIIAPSNETKLSDDQILEIYELLKH